MNANIAKLQSYPFARLNQLKAQVQPSNNLAPIRLEIGEPQEQTPKFINDTIITNLQSLQAYPNTKGLPELRQAIAKWLSWRFALPEKSLDSETQILPVNGTREALFAFAQVIINTSNNAQNTTAQPLVMMPNPFYQIYEGAALLAGAEPYFIPYIDKLAPDFAAVSPKDWQRCQLLYICSPGNPTGSVLDLATLQYIIKLADQYDFVIAADECYSEIYQDESTPPPGLLQAAATLGRTDYRRCVVFNSLSKRSNCPGLRSGFVAGDATILQHFFLYRTYHGCAMSIYAQKASTAAWSDERHVHTNRDLYREKFAAVTTILNPVLPVTIPAATFYLWIETAISDTEFAQNLFAYKNVTVLPGSFLARNVTGQPNPGHKRVRIALTPKLEVCIEAAQRIRHYIEIIS
ncbi:succinyldiaminopimelate aminotransferase [Achromatium sp. WMS1]|nr:succinyldiaminopimelate aminotransferase [Achromatium sp. WMS1]